ncbi:hypothetical protein Tco_0488445 [Tanacetum coccineum]
MADDFDDERLMRNGGDDEVELTDEESFDDEDEITEVDPDLLTKDITGFKTYDDYKNDWIYEWNKDVPWVDEKPWTDTGVWTEPKPDYEWYEALDDCELKEEALRNKAIMDGVINNDESCCELKRKWNIYTNYDDAYEINHEDNGIKNYVKFMSHRDLVKEITTNIVGEFTNLEILKCWSLKNLKAAVQHIILLINANWRT